MDHTAIFAPMFAMFALTAIVWCYMYARRIPFIRGANLTPDQLTALEFTRLSPPAVANPSDNLKNLFEIPVLFYAFVLYLYATGSVDPVEITGAWVFFALRTAHSAVHCTVNIVMLRFAIYAASTLMLWILIARAAWQQFGG
jgi:hypothetical protein